MIDPANPTIGGCRCPACRIVPEELAAVLRDEAMLREAGLDVPPRQASVPRVSDPWPRPRHRVDWLRFVTWSAFLAVALVWVALLGWLLVQGGAWVLAWLP